MYVTAPPPHLAPPRTALALGGGGVRQALSSGDVVDKGQALAHLYNAGRTGADGARALGGEVSSLWKALTNLRGNAVFSSLKGLAQASLPLMQRSAVFEAAISAASNGIRLFQGRIGFGEFAGRVTGDSMAGFVGGAGAALAGAVALALLPATGLLGTIVAAVAGLGGYSLAAGWFRSSGIYRSVVGTVRSAFGGR
jgi:hypothetical protein